jgi:hypothetical protein
MSNVTQQTSGLKPENKQQAEELIQKMKEMQQKLEDAMVEIALEWDISLSLGEYGSGRTLLLQDDHWSGKERGEWLHSSETC